MRGPSLTEEPVARRGWGQPRGWLAVACAIPSLVALGAEAVHVFGSNGADEFGCWVLPNAYIVRAPGTQACEIKTNGRVRKVFVGEDMTHVFRSEDLAPELASGRVVLPIEVKYGHDEFMSTIRVQHVDAVTQRSQCTARGLVRSSRRQEGADERWDAPKCSPG